MKRVAGDCVIYILNQTCTVCFGEALSNLAEVNSKAGYDSLNQHTNVQHPKFHIYLTILTLFPASVWQEKLFQGMHSPHTTTLFPSSHCRICSDMHTSALFLGLLRARKELSWLWTHWVKPTRPAGCKKFTWKGSDASQNIGQKQTIDEERDKNIRKVNLK